MADERRIDRRIRRLPGDPSKVAHGPPQSDPIATEAPGADDTAAATVIGLDGSETSWSAFWWGCGEALRLGGRAVAVFVSPTIEANAALASAAGACDYTEVERCVSEQAAELEEEVRRHAAADRFDLAFVHARGDPAQELLRVAEAVNAQLIAVGRSTKARHRVVGSLGRRLLSKRRAPIIVVVP
jgi:nucleotide-binding universal stress UspA family protein